jgi:flavin reductase (DIM6/NTAB) family NADH-FMN oxidoreductase RutF
MHIRPDQLPYKEFYRILLNAVVPRPIAWVSTLSREGQPNLAPFSFFNVVSAKPPLLGFSPSLRQIEAESFPKDTLRNIREMEEFVVNLVPFELADAMNVTSGEYDQFVNEFELAKLATRASELVRPPQVADSPVNFECKLRQILDFGHEAPSGSLVIGEIVSVHMNENVLKEGHLDPDAFELVGRMGGVRYCRTRERFEMTRPKLETKT